MVYLSLFRVTSLALGQSYDCPSSSEVNLRGVLVLWFGSGLSYPCLSGQSYDWQITKTDQQNHGYISWIYCVLGYSVSFMCLDIFGDTQKHSARFICLKYCGRISSYILSGSYVLNIVEEYQATFCQVHMFEILWKNIKLHSVRFISLKYCGRISSYILSGSYV